MRKIQSEMMNRLWLIIFACLLVPSLAWGQGKTIDQLGTGAALTGTEKLPMFQSANPALSTTPRAVATYLPTVLDAIDASQSTMTGGDPCTRVAAAAVTAYNGGTPLYHTIDAQGITSWTGCVTSMFTGWPASIGGVDFPVTILWGSALLPASAPEQVAPPGVVFLVSSPIVGTPYKTASAPQLPPAITAAACYVSPTGNDSNAGATGGDINHPWLTLGHAQTQMQAGGSICSSTNPKTTYLRAGTYSPAGGNTTCGGMSYPEGIEFGGSDANTVWSVYPPDGIGSAILDGSAGGSSGMAICAFIGSDTPITIYGLQIQNYNFEGIISFWSGLRLYHNIIHDIAYNTAPPSSNGSGINLAQNSQNDVVSHNYVYRTGGAAIQAAFGGPGYGNNLTYQFNVAEDYCYGSADCGGLYLEDLNSAPSTGITVRYNYVKDGNPAQTNDHGALCLYGDAGTSNVTWYGNICTGYQVDIIHQNAGKNNTWIYNVFDLGYRGKPIAVLQNNLALSSCGQTTLNQVGVVAGTTSLTVTANASFPQSGTFAAEFTGDGTNDIFRVTSGAGTNTWTVTRNFAGSTAASHANGATITATCGDGAGQSITNNVIISGGGSAGGYAGNGPGVAPTIQNNLYYAYGGTISSAGSGGSPSDSAPYGWNPGFTDATYQLPANSLARQSPVSFPALPPNWGPMGFTLPNYGTIPAFGATTLGTPFPQGYTPALSSCGTNPTITGNSLGGLVTMGTGSPTGCVITFVPPYTNVPFCTADWIATPLASQSYVTTAAAITLTQTATSSNKVQYSCIPNGF